MTRAQALRLARKARYHGYFRPTPSTLGVTCPECRCRVDTDYVSSQGSIAKHLDRALVEHLVGGCDS